MNAGAPAPRARAPLLVLLLAAAPAGCAHGLGAAPKTGAGEEVGWTRVPDVNLRQQNHEHDCGAVALDMVLDHWKVAPPPRKRANMEATSGLTAGEMRDQARRLDLEAFAFAGEVDDLVYEIDNARPVIVGLLLDDGGQRLSHFVVVVGHDRAADRFLVADPARGWRTLARADLERTWAAAGRPTLVVHPRG